jgi:hypothetical protein
MQTSKWVPHCHIHGLNFKLKPAPELRVAPIRGRWFMICVWPPGEYPATWGATEGNIALCHWHNFGHLRGKIPLDLFYIPGSGPPKVRAYLTCRICLEIKTFPPYLPSFGAISLFVRSNLPFSRHACHISDQIGLKSRHFVS